MQEQAITTSPAGIGECYDRVAMALHWSIALLILLNVPLGLFSETIEAALGRSLMWVHKSIGLTVLALTILRLLWRLSHRPPPLPSEISGWRARAAGLTHAGLYVLMIVVPLTGWMRSSASGYPLRLFDLVEIPKFAIAPRSAAASAAATGHEVSAWAMLILMAIHVAAALHHHLVLRDAVLARMAPRVARRSGTHRHGEAEEL